MLCGNRGGFREGGAAGGLGKGSGKVNGIRWGNPGYYNNRFFFGCHGLRRSLARVPLQEIAKMDIEHRKKLHHFNLPGQAHELTFSCYRRLPLLSRDRTSKWLMEAIESARNKQEYAVLAFVIMPEHVHIIVYPFKQQYDISWFLKSIKQSVSRKAHTWLDNHDRQWFGKLTASGNGNFRFWQAGGGYDRNIDRRSTLMWVIDYIHQNPVRRGLVEKAADWPWSSASWYEGKECVLPMDSIP